MNAAIQSLHCDCERNVCTMWTQLIVCTKEAQIWLIATHNIKMEYFDSCNYPKRNMLS